jgi:hypothetical protein
MVGAERLVLREMSLPRLWIRGWDSKVMVSHAVWLLLQTVDAAGQHSPQFGDQHLVRAQTEADQTPFSVVAR